MNYDFFYPIILLDSLNVPSEADLDCSILDAAAVLDPLLTDLIRYKLDEKINRIHG